MFDILSDKMTGGKLLVFAHHRNVLDALEQGVLRSGHIEYIRIDGRTKASMQCFSQLQGERGGGSRGQNDRFWVPSPLCIKCEIQHCNHAQRNTLTYVLYLKVSRPQRFCHVRSV